MLEVIELSRNISNKAVNLRQQKNLSLGDAVIAATAFVYDFALVTRNVADFKHVDGLRILNPFQ